MLHTYRALRLLIWLLQTCVWFLCFVYITFCNFRYIYVYTYIDMRYLYYFELYIPFLTDRVCPQNQYRVASFAEHFYVNGVIKLRTVYKTYQTLIPVCCPSFIQVVDECIGELVAKLSYNKYFDNRTRIYSNYILLRTYTDVKLIFWMVHLLTL